MSEKKTVISDTAHRQLGSLVENDTHITVYDTGHRPLARYDKASGYTLTMSGVRVAQGNILTSYLYR